MRILIITNINYKAKNLIPIGWNIMPSMFKKFGHEVEALGKYNQWNFYFKYLKFKPDIIVSSWVPAGFIPALFKKAALISCPIVHLWDDYYTEMMTNYPSFLVGFMEDYTARNSNYIATVLISNGKRAKEMKKPVFLMPYGVTGGNKKTELNLAKLKTRKSNLIAIYSGEQNKWKRVDRIINAVKGQACDLFLLGTINPELQALAKGHKNIHFIGFVNPKEIISILKQADILVNTANHDISMKFLDYISAGKPILAYDDRPANFFKHKETAYLTRDFKQGIKELIENKKLRKKLSSNIKSVKLYSWDQVAKIHLMLYKNIIEKKNLKKFETSYYHIQPWKKE